jgi:hypothetical protein
LSGAILAAADQAQPNTGLYVLGGAVIAAAGSIIGVLATLLGQSTAAKRSASLEAKKMELNRKTRQISELYGPLIMLRGQSKYLWNKLKEGKENPDSWRLLDHVTEVISNPMDYALARRILEINAQVETLIVTHSGLFWHKRPPESFIEFLQHYSVLRIAIQERKVPDDKRFAYFPDEFDDDVSAAYDALRAGVDKGLV